MKQRAGTIARRVFVAACLVALLDFSSGFFVQTDRTPHLCTKSPSESGLPLLLVFPGFAADGCSSHDAFTAALGQPVHVVAVQYPEGDIDDDAIYALVRQEIEQASPDRIVVLAGSMGGMVATRFLGRLAQDSSMSEFHSVELFLDAAPISQATVRRSSALFAFSQIYRGGVVSSLGWRLISRFQTLPDPEAGVSTVAVDEGNAYNHGLGTWTLAAQARYIADFDPREISKALPAVRRATYLSAPQSALDPVVDVPRSIQGWRRYVPSLEVVETPSRHGEWHLPWTYRPRELLVAMGFATTTPD
ncbi:hypothetical protein JNB_13078 [Janibacter sp. HTCC2649]|nr:hypothetical protein JNB_13078 [Janibacter sp. HTCC2649]